MDMVSQPNLKSQTLPNNVLELESRSELINTIPVRVPAIRNNVFLLFIFIFLNSFNANTFILLTGCIQNNPGNRYS